MKDFIGKIKCFGYVLFQYVLILLNKKSIVCIEFSEKNGDKSLLVLSKKLTKNSAVLFKDYGQSLFSGYLFFKSRINKKSFQKDFFKEVNKASIDGKMYVMKG